MKRLRQRQGWTQEDLSVRAGCSVRSVQNAEAGNGVDAKTVKFIAEALGVQVSELIKVRSPDVQEGDRLLPLIVLSCEDPAMLALLPKLITITIEAQGEITIKFKRQGSVIIGLDMNEADALRLLSLFPSFREHARAALADTPEGKAFFSGANPEGLDLANVKLMAQLIDEIRELRFETSADAAAVAEAKRASLEPLDTTVKDKVLIINLRDGDFTPLRELIDTSAIDWQAIIGVLLNLKEITLLPAAYVGILLRLKWQAEGNGKRLTLVNVSDDVVESLEIQGVASNFGIRSRKNSSTE